MISLVMIIGSVIIMVKAAELEHRSPFLWGVYTLISCLVCARLIPMPLVNIFIGLVISFSTMFVSKIIQDKN